MASQVFDRILGDASRKGVIINRSRESVQWLRKAAARVPAARVSPSKMLGTDDKQGRFDNSIRIGNMYMFMYDPKHKDSLPFYDRFPLVFPIGKAPGGFYGINLHYLHPRLRAVLMDRLMGDVMNNEKYDETTKLRLSYRLLKSASKYRYFEPCVKHYLTKHVRSRLIYIYPNEWQMALFLPTERFEKAEKKVVWEDSRQKISGIS